MDLLLRVANAFDERLLANLVAVHLVLGLILVVSVVVRKVLLHGGNSLVRWTGLHWLDHVGQEANRRVRTLMFWTTLLAMVSAVATGIVYHVAGRDARADFTEWYQHLTGAEILAWGLTLGKLAILAVTVQFAMSLVRGAMHWLERHAFYWLHISTHGTAPAPASPAPITDAEKAHQEETVHHWFHLLERFCLAAIVLVGLWIGGIVLAWGAAALAAEYVLAFLTIIMLARLATLASRSVFHALEHLSQRHMETSPFRRYWERLLHMFPFGQKCFEGAVYIFAATQAMALFDKLAQLGEYGDRAVGCIGIFFVTRMVLELLHTLINEAFGMYEEDAPADQKNLTLVPLLQSVVQYAVYFASFVVMLHVLKLPTEPILAGAGIIGLAGALGAQSLITDLVSGFFILFENQYLVGDVVQISDAQGRVEAISIRSTQVRDETGKLFIIPNGQVKNVVNYSKGYVNAVVDYKAPTSNSLDQLMADMSEAGRRLKKLRREVLAETIVKGLVDLTPGEMTIRAITKVQPGAHQAMQIEYRRLLKQVLDERQAVAKAA